MKLFNSEATKSILQEAFFPVARKLLKDFENLVSGVHLAGVMIINLTSLKSKPIH